MEGFHPRAAGLHGGGDVQRWLDFFLVNQSVANKTKVAEISPG